MDAAGDTCDFTIHPDRLRAAAKALAAVLILPTRPDFVVGFAPGGIPLTVALAYELDLPAVIAYKTRLGLPGELAWTEPFCFTNTFCFYGATEGTRVLLVDDEVDSGSTVANAVTALRARGVSIVDVGSAVEVRHGGRAGGRPRAAPGPGTHPQALVADGHRR